MLSVGLYIVAGFLFYTVSVLAFIDGAALDASAAASDASDASFPKWLPIIIFAVPAILTLVVVRNNGLSRLEKRCGHRSPLRGGIH